ncbi:MAG: hypothetical protein SPE01_11880, partial [Candidatus Spyradocola sp.]|nr:hypothetical protein [Candidatus Spyradocola sp.]
MDWSFFRSAVSLYRPKTHFSTELGNLYNFVTSAGKRPHPSFAAEAVKATFPCQGKASLSTKSTGSKKMKPHLFRIAEKFAHGLAAHEFFCIGSDFPSANGL